MVGQVSNLHPAEFPQEIISKTSNTSIAAFLELPRLTLKEVAWESCSEKRQRKSDSMPEAQTVEVVLVRRCPVSRAKRDLTELVLQAMRSKATLRL
jgi:hypothetical protein